MEEITFTSELENVLSKKSWTAYIIPTLITFFLCSLLSSTTYYYFMLIPIIFFIIKVLDLNSVKLYFDDEGVWIYSGIFPWNKGVNGVKWRDLDEAVYFTGFWSWAFKSYTIRISHRFTKSSEIVLSHMKLGNKAVTIINEEHRKIVDLRA